MEQMDNSLRKQVLAEIDALAPQLFAIARHIYDHPEIKFEEFEAMRVLSSALEEAGFQVKRGVAGLPTAFVARAEGQLSGPTIGLLGEYDALPEIGHGCGHHLVGTIALGASLALRKVLSQLAGQVVYCGTPAEEMAGGGKITMAEAGVFDGLDAAMLVHPSDRTVVESCSLCGGRVIFTFRGKSAHAAVAPHLGINALDAVLLTYNNINALRQHLRPDVRIHGVITQGGGAYNVVPDLAEAIFSVRAADYAYRQETLQKVIRCAEAGALATGATLSMDVSPTFKEMRTNFTLARAFAAHCAEFDLEVEPADRSRLGGTDMGNVSHAVPAIHPFVAIVPRGVQEHTPEFAAVTITEEAMMRMIIAAKLMALTALDFLTQPELRTQVKQEFEAEQA
ncbi:MAG: M20 family metallopeptidase [Chloroflexi bacterium]|nr:M20 family metallopeptidase [Chloroflexota bacterium]